MPTGRLDQSLYLGPFASVEAMNATVLYKPGELGSQIQLGTKAYQLIQVDSGATASTAGAPVCGSLAFWKDRSKYLVTTDKIQAEGNPAGSLIANTVNSVAGVFCSLTSGAAGTASITAGNYGVIQQRGNHVGVLGDTSVVAGDLLVAKTTGATPSAARSASGTAPVSQVVARATASVNAVTTGYTPAMLGSVDLVDVP